VPSLCACSSGREVAPSLAGACRNSATVLVGGSDRDGIADNAVASAPPVA
jgi:hypothetical protein